MGVADPLDADILVISSNKGKFSDGNYDNMLKRKYGYSDEDYRFILQNIEELYYSPYQAWSYADIVGDPKTKRRILGYLSVIEPKYGHFRAHLAKSIFTALGYGNGLFIQNNLKSVHTHSNYEDIEGSDYLILHFLYNSEVKSGMSRKAAVELFRQWLSSDYFKKNINIKIDDD